MKAEIKSFYPYIFLRTDSSIPITLKDWTISKNYFVYKLTAHNAALTVMPQRLQLGSKIADVVLKGI